MTNANFSYTEIAQKLLSERDKSGKIPCRDPYQKWYGPHWVLSQLADIGYPKGDLDLIPIRQQVYEWIFSDRHANGIRVINGLTRRCASQEGNIVYSLTKLGLDDEKTEILVKKLIGWQWPDGGWNCDKNPSASHSSFMESLIPFRGLVIYGKERNHQGALKTAKKASEIFLKRHMYLGENNGKVIQEDFIHLHYPCFWHYDILFGLKVMAEAGFLSDKRCKKAIELLTLKKLPDGTFPAERKFYKVISKEETVRKSGSSLVDWGGTSKKTGNFWVSRDANFVLQQVKETR
jgi:hypothetical protein